MSRFIRFVSGAGVPAVVNTAHIVLAREWQAADGLVDAGYPYVTLLVAPKLEPIMVRGTLAEITTLLNEPEYINEVAPATPPALDTII